LRGLGGEGGGGVGGKGGGGGRGGEMTQALYAHMNNKTIKKVLHYISLFMWKLINECLMPLIHN
jgi:hypothetical protein